MKRWRLVVTILVCAHSVVLIEGSLWQKFAMAKRDETQLRRDASSRPANRASERPPVTHDSKAEKSFVRTVRGKESEDIRNLSTLIPARSKAIGRKGRRRAKVSKKITQNARVEPSRELIHHGVLEGPQRYDPRPNYRTAGVRNPGTRDLIHDHFLELDRNQDGRIDPMERVFGRLDMDRDLYGRHF